MVPVGRVELHHREFGVVPNRDAFVAEAAVDLEHALEAAHDQALQVQLRRDAQVHLLVERVVVRDEGLRVRAAGDRVQHRRLDLEEAVVHHEGADRAERLAARDEALARVLVRDQVDIPLAVLLFLVAHAVERVGQRAQRLGQQAQFRDLDRQFAGLGDEQRALDAEDVAQIPVLELLVDVRADVVDRDPQLDPPGAVLQRAERGLAHGALEHHAAGDADGDRLGLERLVGQAAVLAHQVGRAILGLEVVRERDASSADRGQFLASLGDQLVFVERGGGRGGVHARRSSEEGWGSALRLPENPRF